MTEDYWNKTWNKRKDIIINELVKPLFSSDFKIHIIKFVKTKMIEDLKINENIVNDLIFNEDEYYKVFEEKLYQLYLIEKLNHNSLKHKLIIIISKSLLAYYINLFFNQLKEWKLIEEKMDYLGNKYTAFDYEELKEWKIINKIN